MRPSESDRGRHNGSGLRCSANGPECVPLSPEPAPGQRHALSDGPARSLSLIFHLRAAWQDLEFCLMHAVLRAAERQQPRNKITLESLARAAGMSCSELLQQLKLQMPPAVFEDGSDCERA